LLFVVVDLSVKYSDLLFVCVDFGNVNIDLIPKTSEFIVVIIVVALNLGFQVCNFQLVIVNFSNVNIDLIT